MEAQRAVGRGYNEPRTTLKKGGSPFLLPHPITLSPHPMFVYYPTR